MKRGSRQGIGQSWTAQSDQPAPSARPPRAPADQLPAAFADDIDAFIGFLDLERGLSPHTARATRATCDQCARFLVRRGVAGLAGRSRRRR